jgi:hypothetical protein
VTHKKLVYGIAWTAAGYSTSTAIVFATAPEWPVLGKLVAVPVGLAFLAAMFAILMVLG